MPQPTQRHVVAESIPPRIDIELPPAPIVMTEQAVVSTTAGEQCCAYQPQSALASTPLPPSSCHIDHSDDECNKPHSDCNWQQKVGL